jgi:hypothetical protein
MVHNHTNSETNNNNTGFSIGRWMLHAKQMPAHKSILPFTLVYQTKAHTAKSVKAMDKESMSDQVGMTPSYPPPATAIKVHHGHRSSNEIVEDKDGQAYNSTGGAGGRDQYSSSRTRAKTSRRRS